MGPKLHAVRGRLAGIAQRRFFKTYGSLSSVPTGELEVLAGFLKESANVPGPSQAGLVGPVVMAELARRNRAKRDGCRRPEGTAR
jgi:hypothetical protein